MFPITLDEIERAYAEQGIEPVCGCWAKYYSDGQYDARKCGCALSAVIARRTNFDEAVAVGDGFSDFSDVEVAAALLHLSPEQVNAFVCGFDHGMSWKERCGPSDSEAEREAFAAGVAAREKVKPVEFDAIPNAS